MQELVPEELRAWQKFRHRPTPLNNEYPAARATETQRNGKIKEFYIISNCQHLSRETTRVVPSNEPTLEELLAQDAEAE